MANSTNIPAIVPDTQAKAAARKQLTEHCGNMIHALEDGISRHATHVNAPMRHEAARLKVLLDLFSLNDPRLEEIIHQTIH